MALEKWDYYFPSMAENSCNRQPQKVNLICNQRNKTTICWAAKLSNVRDTMFAFSQKNHKAQKTHKSIDSLFIIDFPIVVMYSSEHIVGEWSETWSTNHVTLMTSPYYLIIVISIFHIMWVLIADNVCNAKRLHKYSVVHLSFVDTVLHSNKL